MCVMLISKLLDLFEQLGILKPIVTLNSDPKRNEKRKSKKSENVHWRPRVESIEPLVLKHLLFENQIASYHGLLGPMHDSSNRFDAGLI